MISGVLAGGGGGLELVVATIGVNSLAGISGGVSAGLTATRGEANFEARAATKEPMLAPQPEKAAGLTGVAGALGVVEDNDRCLESNIGFIVPDGGEGLS